MGLSTLRGTLLGLLVAAVGAAPVAGADPRRDDPRDTVRIGRPWLALAVGKAVLGADAWLGRPACARVFTAFSDRSGRLLSEVLEERGLDGRAHLRLVTFEDGSTSAICKRGPRAAYTHPGSDVVYVCPAFERVEKSHPQGRALVIHELLHTLGLGEDPPDSSEITRRVLEHCR